MSPRVLTLALALLAAFLTGLNGIASLPMFVGPPLDVAVQSDFRAFLAGGDLVAQGRADVLYDIPAQFEVQRTRFPIMESESQTLAFVNPPFFPLALAPLSGLATPLAYRVWMLFTVLQVGAAMFLASLLLPSWGRRRWVVGAGTLLAFLPAWVTVWQGQSSAVLLCGFLGGWLGLRERKPVLAGLALSLLLIKPQLVPLVALALLAARQWRAITGLAIGGAAFGLAGTLVTGPAGWLRWIELGGHIVESGAVYGIKPRLMYTSRSLMQVLAGTDSLDPVRIPWLVVVMLCLVAIGVVAAKTRMRTGAAWGALASLALLASPHAYLHDVLILAVAGVALLERAPADGAVRALPILAVCASWTLIWSSMGMGMPPVLGVPAILILLAGVVVSRRLDPSTAVAPST